MENAGIPDDVWDRIRFELEDLVREGYGHLLTEETLRIATAKALGRAGVPTTSMRTEVAHPVLKGSRIDLVLDRALPQVIEFKWPREPNQNTAAWTMALGEVLKDFYRLAVHPEPATRWFVIVETAALRKYMSGVHRYGVNLDTETVALRKESVMLPQTAQRITGSLAAAHDVDARRVYVAEIKTADPSHDLRLAVYRVEPIVEARWESAELGLLLRLHSSIEEARLLGYDARVFRDMLTSRGPVLTAEILMQGQGFNDGLVRLAELDRLDLSLEAIILEPEFVGLFQAQAIATAMQRLDELNYMALPHRNEVTGESQAPQSGRAIWSYLVEAGEELSRRGLSPFTRGEVIQQARLLGCDADDGSLNPIFQGLVENAPGKAPQSQYGKAFRRLESNSYEFIARSLEQTDGEPEAS